MKYALIVLAAGIALLLASHAAGLQIVHTLAVLILVGAALAFGVVSGLKAPATSVLDKVTRVLSHATACIVAVVLVSPAFAALLAAAYGIVAASNDAFGKQRDLLFAGGAIALVLLVAAMGALFAVLAAVRGKGVQATDMKTPEKQP